jgi:hypothetical protein
VSIITGEWQSKDSSCKIIYPDHKESRFSDEAQSYIYIEVSVFFKSCLKNASIDLGGDLMLCLHQITSKLAKTYYMTSDEFYKSNVMDCLAFINYSDRYSRLLDGVTHPANQNIYAESAKLAKKGA